MLLANMGYDLMFRHLVDQIGARLAPSARRSLEHSAPQYPRRTLVAGGSRIARGNKNNRSRAVSRNLPTWEF